MTAEKNTYSSSQSTVGGMLAERRKRSEKSPFPRLRGVAPRTSQGHSGLALTLSRGRRNCRFRIPANGNPEPTSVRQPLIPPGDRSYPGSGENFFAFHNLLIIRSSSPHDCCVEIDTWMAKPAFVAKCFLDFTKFLKGLLCVTVISGRERASLLLSCSS